MGDLFARWQGMVARHSRRAVDAYVRELPDFHLMSTDARSRTGMLDFAFFLRERTVALAAEGRPFGEDDLAVMVAVGRERGAAGVSPVAQRRVLALHTSLTLREVHEAATPVDVTDVMHALRWLPDQGAVAQAAYTQGYLRGQEALRPVVDRVRSLVSLLLAGDAFADDVAAGLAMTRHEHAVVAVVRMPGPAPGPAERADLLTDLLAHHWLPVRWEEPGEFVALVGADDPAAAEERTREVVRDFVDRVDVPCAVGAARGPAGGSAGGSTGAARGSAGALAGGSAGALGGALDEARQVCRVAPLGRRAGEVRYRDDLFAELGAVAVPSVDAWLGETARRLAEGPDLIATLDAFYRNDMHRTRSAAALSVHPRTLDYRLDRVRHLTGLDPASARGVLVLSTTVTRALSGAYS
ncbi:helix-turn-helix domain-containing protein [Saccharothrix xinjiangensis]|uniref:Helix-turn-helix domain-containing protein n=1 Tax=Saccharothrix xinjiangensis TaxID=204798 RepID=A0ABV9YEX6_9PSEU